MLILQSRYVMMRKNVFSQDKSVSGNYDNEPSVHIKGIVHPKIKNTCFLLVLFINLDSFGDICHRNLYLRKGRYR